ncbi:MAG: CBS domain-containing protein [Planctomycetaceae bacterium]|nr:CBS domain-containing protein [Planctomycetales bacterium]MCB9925118.1 CBS domain-containing protein [Planctomycetaceae bacterium]
MMHCELSNIVTYNPCVLEGQTTLGELAELVHGADFHHWPVVDDDRRLLGMLASVDLVRIFEAAATALEVAGERRQERLATVCNQPISELMPTRVLSIQQNQSPATALWMLVENRIHALPVLTDDYLTALATTSDFLREFSYGGSLAACLSVSEMMQDAGEPMDCDATLDEVAMAIHFTASGVTPIVRGDLPLGVVSRRELGRLKLGKTLREVFRGEFASEKSTSILALAASAPTIRPGERLGTAAQLMLEHGRQAIAVVNQAGRLLGVVTEEAILRAMLDEMRS